MIVVVGFSTSVQEIPRSLLPLTVFLQVSLYTPFGGVVIILQFIGFLLDNWLHADGAPAAGENTLLLAECCPN